jgi:bifunctional DNase/RNase
MSLELIPTTFYKILQSRSYTTIILEGGGKKFAIYTDSQVGKNIQMHLARSKKSRPSSQELIHNILRGYNIRPLQIVIQNVEDSIYFARLFLEMETEEKKTFLEIDARPSDCITLALLSNIPMFCRKEVLDKLSEENINI